MENKNLVKIIDRSEIQEMTLKEGGKITSISFKDASEINMHWPTENIITTPEMIYLVAEGPDTQPPATKQFTRETFRDVRDIIVGLVLTTPINQLEEKLHEKFCEMETDLF